MSASFHVIVVGGANVDLQGVSYAPFRPKDSNPGRVSLSVGGVGRNIAENLARLGCGVELVSVLGEDALSERLRASCASVGIGTGLCLVLPEGSASRYLCLLDSDGSLLGAVAAMEGMGALTPDVLEERRPSLERADLVVADTNLPPESLEWLTRNVRGKPLLLDPVSAAKAGRAGACVGAFTLVKPNRAEAEALTGVSCADEAGAAQAAAELRRRGVERVFLSVGRGGLLFDSPEGRGVARPPETKAVNVSGAGDAASAALGWAFLCGYDAARSARLGAAAALLTVASWETVSPRISPETLEEASEGVRCERIL